MLSLVLRADDPLLCPLAIWTAALHDLGLDRLNNEDPLLPPLLPILLSFTPSLSISPTPPPFLFPIRRVPFCAQFRV